MCPAEPMGLQTKEMWTCTGAGGRSPNASAHGEAAAQERNRWNVGLTWQTLPALGTLGVTVTTSSTDQGQDARLYMHTCHHNSES